MKCPRAFPRFYGGRKIIFLSSIQMQAVTSILVKETYDQKSNENAQPGTDYRRLTLSRGQPACKVDVCVLGQRQHGECMAVTDCDRLSCHCVTLVVGVAPRWTKYRCTVKSMIIFVPGLGWKSKKKWVEALLIGYCMLLIFFPHKGCHDEICFFRWFQRQNNISQQTVQ